MTVYDTDFDSDSGGDIGNYDYNMNGIEVLGAR